MKHSLEKLQTPGRIRCLRFFFTENGERGYNKNKYNRNIEQGE